MSGLESKASFKERALEVGATPAYVETLAAGGLDKLWEVSICMFGKSSFWGRCTVESRCYSAGWSRALSCRDDGA